MIQNFFHEIWEEFEDFFEDLSEHLFHYKPKHKIPKRNVVIGGVQTAVRPAYLFAERLDNNLKLLFGVSMIISAITASFFGYSTLSELLKELITSVPGRIFMFAIGTSYFITALWKLLHLGEHKS